MEHDRDEGPGLTIDAETTGASVQLRLVGDLDVATVGLLLEHLADLDADCREVVLDLGGVGFLDSTGVGAIVHAARDAAVGFRTLRIVEPSARARFVFEVTGLSDLLAS